MSTPVKIDTCGANSLSSVSYNSVGGGFISGAYDSNNQLLLACTNGTYLELRYYGLLPPDGNPYDPAWTYNSVFINLFLTITGNTTNPITNGTYYTTGLFNNTDFVIRYDGTLGTYEAVFVSGGSGGLSNIQGMVWGPDSNLYVSSQATSSIKKYSGTTGAYVSDFVATGIGGLSHPAGLAFGSDGNLYVADQYSSTIRKYNGSTGAFISNFVVDANIGDFVSFAFGSDHNIYVGQYSANATIRKYNGSTGAFMSVFSSGNPNLPYGISGLAFDSSGSLYASRDNSNIVEYYNSSGAYQGVFVSDNSGGLNQAGSLVFGPDTNLYVCSKVTCQVLQYNGSTGAFMSVFCSSGALTPTGLLFATYSGSTDLFVGVDGPTSTGGNGSGNRNIFSSTSQYYENSTLTPAMYVWSNGNYTGNLADTTWFITSTTPGNLPAHGTSYWQTAPAVGITGAYVLVPNGGTGAGTPVVTLSGTRGCSTPTFYVDGDVLIGTWCDGVGSPNSSGQQVTSPSYYFGGNLYQTVSTDHGQTWTTYSSQKTNTWQFNNSLIFPTGWTSGFITHSSVIVKRNLVVFGYHVNDMLAEADGADGWYFMVVRNYVDSKGFVTNHIDFNAPNATSNNVVISPPKLITAFANYTCHGKALLRDDGTIEFAAMSGLNPGTICFNRCTRWDFSNNSTWVNHSNLDVTTPVTFKFPDGELISNFTEYVVGDFSYTYRVSTLVVVVLWGVYSSGPIFEDGTLYQFQYSGLLQNNGSYAFNPQDPQIAHQEFVADGATHVEYLAYDAVRGSECLISRKDAVVELVSNEYLSNSISATITLYRNTNLSAINNTGSWF